jgi:hypothetical protein
MKTYWHNIRNLILLIILSLAFTKVPEITAQSLNHRVYLPLVLNNYKSPPPASTSRYMQTTDTTVLYNEGCSQGSAGENGVVVLDFGKPWYTDSTYGTFLFPDATQFRTTSQIQLAVQSFLSGYWACSPVGAFLTLAIGTNNSGSQVTNAHGQAWAQMVTNLDLWISSPPSYASKEAVAGAIDIEALWSTAPMARSWALGYSQVYTRPYYNYGNCGSCPYTGHPTVPDNGWSVDDFWYVSWGASAAWPLPEIYNTQRVDASRWQFMRLYIPPPPGSRMYIQGAFTQWQACQGRSCAGMDNTPDVGWLQLYNELNFDSSTAQDLNWSTDITWDN